MAVGTLLSSLTRLGPTLNTAHHSALQVTLHFSTNHATQRYSNLLALPSPNSTGIPPVPSPPTEHPHKPRVPSLFCCLHPPTHSHLLAAFMRSLSLSNGAFGLIESKKGSEQRTMLGWRGIRDRATDASLDSLNFSFLQLLTHIALGSSA